MRAGKREDLAVLQQIELAAQSVFPPADLPPNIARPTRAEELVRAIDAGLLWVAQDGRHGPVGFIACEAVDSALHILEMDVTPSHARRGIGTTLLLHMIAEAERIPAVRAITLTTFVHLPWNAPFYASNGFQPVAGGGSFGHLVRALAQERARGLRNRVAMVRDVA